MTKLIQEPGPVQSGLLYEKVMTYLISNVSPLDKRTSVSELRPPLCQSQCHNKSLLKGPQAHPTISGTNCVSSFKNL
ncbi:unnamed protein product [Allacma fusca]|uniref:Uncharacterized protein n=1 Tax=Allacma fusca TaxID=39272 RepID=A0A8J2K423_9HEXA|nr:unnamed protein product [Allacma fusca]